MDAGVDVLLMKDSPCDREWHPKARRRICLLYSMFCEGGEWDQREWKMSGGN
jgi:hypothetical protein